MQQMQPQTQELAGDWLADIIASEPVMLLLGMLSHFLKAIIEARRSGEEMGFRQYWIQYKYQSALSVIASLCFYVILIQMEELSLLTAFGAGYLGDNAADIIGKRTGAKV